MTEINGLKRITFDPQIMAGQACIRGMRMPVSIDEYCSQWICSRILSDNTLYGQSKNHWNCGYA